MKSAVLLPLLFLPLCPAAVAGDWKGDAALGLLSSSGNTETRSINGKLAVDYAVTDWKNSFLASAFNSADSGQTTNERYVLGNKTDYNFNPQNYAFAALEFEKDLFGGVRERTSETVGYGRRILTGPVHELEAEIGAGARQLQVAVSGRRDDDLILRAAGRWRWTISPTSAFEQKLKVESGEANTFSESFSELKLSIVGNLFAGLSFTVRNNSDVPAATQPTDTFSAVNLSYTFARSRP